MLRQNSTASTATALKEHFILERIAEEEKLDVEEGDYDKEIFLIAAQSGESPRRVRAQLEKRGLMDVLRNQIIERKVLELVQSEAKFKDEPYEPEKSTRRRSRSRRVAARKAKSQSPRRKRTRPRRSRRADAWCVALSRCLVRIRDAG